MTDRDLFLALLYTTPHLRADAIVVLCGEDADMRMRLALELFRQDGAPRIICSGGKHELPRWKGASAVEANLFGQGVAPDRIIVESESQNTAEQAKAVVRMACDAGWQRLILVASPYHAPRAHLTFLKALINVGHEKKIQLLSIPASQAPWYKAPPGMTETRADLFAIELDKIDAYGSDVATYEQGVAAFKFWETGE